MEVVVDVGRADVVALALLVDVLEQLLTGDVLARLDDPREPPVAQFDLLALAALRPKLEDQFRAVDVDMPVPHRGQAEGAVVAGVFVVADADQRRLEQANDRGEDLFARQAGAGHVLRHALRSEEQTSELQSLMRISYAGFCLTKKTQQLTYA